MITRINLNNVACFKSLSTLETDKKVNLIYGLNGTGKSTLSNFLYKQNEEKFKNCSIDGLDDNHEILVYNQTFIQDNFFESENLKGIFTLSKMNKEAETAIAKANNEITKIESDKKLINIDLENEILSINQKIEDTKNITWRIKTDYSGGDRVLEFCLDGYKGSKDSLFNHITGLTKTPEKPIKTIEELKRDIQSISGKNAQTYPQFDQVEFTSQNLELDGIFKKQIIGNENTTVSKLIQELNNSDWVRDGLKYLPIESNEENQTCPFCQEKTISRTLAKSIKNYFDATYESDISTIKTYLEKYTNSILSIPSNTFFEVVPQYDQFKNDFEAKYNSFIQIVNDNKKTIEDKIKAPSVPVTLKESTQALKALNDVIQKINLIITEHNNNIEHEESLRSNTKTTFWQIVRWDYDSAINSINIDKKASKEKTDSLKSSIKNLDLKELEQKSIIAEQQRLTMNIGEAVTNINNGLLDIGITDFRIMNYSSSMYKLARGDNSDGVFRSLSEGEKMIISFLYFLELCRGKSESSAIDKKKVIVIDDPISSLSHVYVFNIGRLIKNEFFGTKESKNSTATWSFKYEQVFILTHSLYFFYEITETKHDDRKETQKLTRLTKNENGSTFKTMHYEEIQNDYQAYWHIIKDENQPPALIANCMRNIIEYFFNFVEKKDLNNCFREDILKNTKFQAFYRYMNRESHSLGQNIFDFKEFNYNDFRDAFAELFNATGYEDHYNKMIR